MRRQRGFTKRRFRSAAPRATLAPLATGLLGGRLTDVFLSYSSKDRGEGEDADGNPREDRVTPIVELLKAQGFDVFWDQTVPPGKNWNAWIKEKLKGAKCAMVLWSEYSVESDNVVHEATIAHKSEKLISILLDPIDADQLPMGLYTHQAVKLIGWSGDDSHDGWRKAVSEVEAKLTPHAPLWLQRAIHSFEADLAGERTRVKSAETRAREMEKKLGKGVEAVLEAERERDAALDEAASAKALLDSQKKVHLDAKAGFAEGQKALAAALTEKQELTSKLAEAQSAVEDAKRALKDATEKHEATTLELRDAKQRLKEAERAKPKRTAASVPVTEGSMLYTAIAGALAFISGVSIGESITAANNSPPFQPVLSLGLPMAAALTGLGGSSIISVVLAFLRRRQLGVLESAFYWFAITAPLALALSLLVTATFGSGFGWPWTSAYFMGFLSAWALLLVSAWYFARQRGAALTAPARAVYWLGVCLPWLFVPAANFPFVRLIGNGFYANAEGIDYSGYIISTLLVLVSVMAMVLWSTAPAGSVGSAKNDGDAKTSFYWLAGVVLAFVVLMPLFLYSGWDWVGAAYYPAVGAAATAALIGLVITLGSAALLARRGASPTAARIYWLGCGLVTIAAVACWFSAKENNWFGFTAADPAWAGCWSGLVVAMLLLLGVYVVRLVFGGRRVASS